MIKMKKVTVYYCSDCSQEFRYKPTSPCKCEVCELCLFYSDKGFCEHTESIDTCADRDSDRVCDIDGFKAKE